MKISNIELKNFKFHHALDFQITKQNSLIYGENGAGKSSIYEALYSNFYFFKNNKIATGQLDIREKFRHRDYVDEMIVNILFDTEDSLTRQDNDLSNKELIENQTIYCANERLLREITADDFYYILKNILLEHFPQVENLLRIHSVFERKLNHLNTNVPVSMYEERKALDEQFIHQFNEYIPINEINQILNKNFEEDFKIYFKINDSSIEDGKLIYPVVLIKVEGVDDREDFHSHFNEAKLKLISIAIYFALAKKYEINSNLKLLILDDFLTSLDMANRKLIVQYILNHFGDYQKLILTHNIQFYNLIIRLLKLRKKNDTEKELVDWSIKNIFIKKNHDKEFADIFDKNEDYLKDAEDELEEYNLEVSGNLLRKEFERTLTEFEQLLELGRVEELDKILKALLDLDYVFSESPTKIVYKSFPKQVEYMKTVLDNPIQPDNCKLDQLRKAITNFEVSLELKKEVYNVSYLKSILLKTEFYKDILMNYASHDDQEKELHSKEFKNAIKILTKLRKMLDQLK